MAEAKLPGLANKATDADRRRGEAERDCTALDEGLTLLQIMGSKLCFTIVGPPKQGPLHEGIQFAASCHIEMAMQLAML
jgi:hypothetical protein